MDTMRLDYLRYGACNKFPHTKARLLPFIVLVHTFNPDLLNV